MTVSAQTYSDIFNDAVRDNVKRATDVAALYNAGAAEKAAYRSFRAEWDKSVDAHRKGIETQLQDPTVANLYKKLDLLLDGKVNADAVKSVLDNMAAQVAAETIAVGQLDNQRIRMLQMMSSISMAEGGMKRYPAFAKYMTRQTTERLLDHDSLDRLEREAKNRRDIYLDIARRAMEKITQQKKRVAEKQAADKIVVKSAAGSKRVTAPPTARFRKVY